MRVSFITGFVMIKFGSALTAGALLLVPALRDRIIRMSRKAVSGDRLYYAANTLYAGGGSTLINVAIWLSHPALVEATQSFKYVVVFVFSYILLRERASPLKLLAKIGAMLLVAAGVGVLAFAA
jgi:hypothetical protein